MFIYCIEVNSLKYIGFDTGPVYKQNRWKTHCKTVTENKSVYKLHQEMSKYGIENCKYSVIENGFATIIELALAEMKYIKLYDSKNNGLNSTYGGDGMGKHLHTLNEDDIAKIKEALSENMKSYNNDVKWKDTTHEDRKVLTSHLHNEEIYRKKSDTLKQFYIENPDAVKEKSKALSNYWDNISDEDLKYRTDCNRINSLKGAKANSKSIKVIDPCGNKFMYDSKTDFVKVHGHIIQRIIQKTRQGLSHKGWQGWEIE